MPQIFPRVIASTFRLQTANFSRQGILDFGFWILNFVKHLDCKKYNNIVV